MMTQKGGGGKKASKRLRPPSNKDHETIEVSNDELEISLFDDNDELV